MHTLINDYKKLLLSEIHAKKREWISDCKVEAPQPPLLIPTPVIQAPPVHEKPPTAPISLSDELLTLFAELFPALYVEKRRVFAALVTHKPASFPFLKRLGGALHASLLPTIAYLVKSDEERRKLCASTSLRLLLIPMDEIKEGAEREAHTLFPMTKTLSCFPLLPISHYLESREKKELLWKTLQSLPLDSLLK